MIRGFVYLFGNDPCVEIDGKYFLSPTVRLKIGVTKNPPDRLLQLRTGAPDCDFFSMWFFGVYSQVAAREVERQLHKYYDAVRLSGEWFELPRNDFEWLHQLDAAFFDPGNLDSPWHELMSAPWTNRNSIILKSLFRKL